MGYLHDTPGHRLLRFLMHRGGHATLSEIARRANDGRLYARAKSELDGLIIEQRCGSPRTRRSVTRVFLTMKGWAACAMLRPAWQPRRLTTDTLKVWLRELQGEKDPWVCQIAHDAGDARELERLRAIGHIRPPLKKRGPKGANSTSFRPGSFKWRQQNHQRVDALLALKDKEIAERAAGTIPSSRPAPVIDQYDRRTRGDLGDFKTLAAPSAPPIPPAPKTPQEEYIDSLRISAEASRQQRQSYVPKDCQPKPPEDPEIARIKAKAVRLRMAEVIRPNGMLWDNRVVSFAEWDANVSE